MKNYIFHCTNRRNMKFAILKYWSVDLTSAVPVNVNAFFFFPEVTKFFSVQVRIIARAGASARAPSCLWHWALPSCFKTRATETRFYTMAFFFSFTRIILYTFRKIPHNFFLICARISSIMNAKKISKFEREEKSNGNPLLHHGIFLSFHEKFPIYIQKDSL